jgi:hypothetical protein
VAALESTVTWAPDEFVTVGDVVRVLTLGNSVDPEGTIGERLTFGTTAGERGIRLDLRNPYFKNIFQYLTVLDPNNDGINNDGDRRLDGRENIDERPHYVFDMVQMPDGSQRQWWHIDDSNSQEWKVRGKININTAPWFVIAQLPWVSQRQGVTFDPALAQAIVDYRDLRGPYAGGRASALNGLIDDDYLLPDLLGRPKPIADRAGFSSIGELNFVLNQTAGSQNYRIDRYALDANDLLTFPDLTRTRQPGQGPWWEGFGLGPGDEIPDDFEERDIIFSRISNLATVRSDIFTAYILVRLGEDGPEKRVVAILDRSDVYRDRYRYKDPINAAAPDITRSQQFGDVKLIALHPVADAR